MLHAKFQDHRTSGSGEEDFFKVFTIYLFFYKCVTNYHIVLTTKANNRHIKKFGKNNVLTCPVQKIKVWKHLSVILKKNRFLSFVVFYVLV